MCADPEVDQLIAKVDPQLWAHHFVLEQPLNSETLHSRVLEDVWHIMDQLFRCLKRSHSGYKAFATAFSRALFVYDQDDYAAVTSVLEKKQSTFDAALRKNSDVIHR